MFALFIFQLLLPKIHCLFESDRIVDLPGLKSAQINFDHFAGFLNASVHHQLFYIFATSQNAPSSDPLILWLNGGPGCSSLIGLFKEHGPYLVNDDGRTLRMNPNSWNQNASILYIEAPIFVGFSKSLDENEQLAWSDDLTSLDIYKALQFFLSIKFPEFRQNRFFISGKSYGGIYVPTLAKRILDGNGEFPINFKGIAIGNGCTNYTLQAYTLLEYSYAHGLVDQQKYSNLQQKCNETNFYECNLELINSISVIVDGLNDYDIYDSCVDAMDQDGIGTVQNGNELSTATHFSQLSCQNDTDLWTYLNQDSVRQSLHIPDSVGVLRWEECSPYTGGYLRQNDAGVENIVRGIVDADIRVLLFYGDTDRLCDALLGQKFAEMLGYQLQEQKMPWHFKKQVGGMKTTYNANGSLIFTTGAGQKKCRNAICNQSIHPK